MLNKIFRGKEIQQKVASVREAIVQTTRPRGHIALLQIGLAVQMFHHYQYKILLFLVRWAQLIVL